MDELGPCRSVHSVRWDCLALPVGAYLGTVLWWTVLLFRGRVDLWLYLLVMALAKLALLAQVLPAAARSVHIHEQGVLVRGLKGETAWRWNELEALQLFLRPRLFPWPGEQPFARRLIVQGHDKTAPVGDETEGFDELFQRIGNAVNANVAGELLACFDEGQEIAFGPVTLQLERGLSVHGQTVPWDEAGPVALNRLGLLRWSNGMVCAVGLITNPQLLIRVLEQQGVDVRELQTALAGGAGRRPDQDGEPAE